MYNGEVWKRDMSEVFDFVSSVYEEHERVAVSYDETCGYPISIRYSSVTRGIFISHFIYFNDKDCGM